MKAPSRKLVLIVAFVIVIGVAAYFFGWFRGTIPTKAAIAPSEKSVNETTSNTPSVVLAPQVEAPKSPPAVVQSSAPVAKSANQLPPVVGMILKQLDQSVDSPPSNSRNGQIQLFIISLAHYEPAVALSKIGLIDELKARNEAIGRIYGEWLTVDTQQGLAELAQLPAGPQTEAYYLQAFQTWAEANPAFPPLAAAAASTLFPGPEREQALSGVATSWVLYDPLADLNWASSLPQTDSAAMYTAVVTVSAQDPNLAAQYVDKITDLSEQNKAIQSISLDMSKTDPSAALAWLNRAATGGTFVNGVAKIISKIVVKDPASATLLLAQVNQPGTSDAAISAVASSNWARVNPQDAASWMSTLPASAVRDVAIQKLTSSTNRN